MYTVTQEFHDAFSALGRDIIYIKAAFNGETELGSDELQELVVTEQFGASGGVTVGSAFSSSCKLTMYAQDGLALRNGYFVPYVGINVGGETVYVPKGKFYIPYDGIEKTDRLWVTVTGYDRMASLTGDYIPAIEFPATPAQILADVCEQANLTAPVVTLPDIQIENAYAGSYREQLGWLAGLIGCNAKFDADGNLVFVWYTDSDLTITQDMQQMNGLKLTGDTFAIQSITTGTEDNAITAGGGTSITFTNPYITKEVAEAVLNLVENTPMHPCTVKWRGDPSVEAGDILSVIGEDGATVLPVFVMEQVLSIKGGMSCETTCYPVEDEDYNVKSPVSQQIERVYNSITESFRNATEKIVGAKGGYYEITYDEDGFPTGWSLRDTPTVTENTKMWIMSTGGLGFSADGGKTVSQIALTSDGYVNATALAVGSSNADGTSEITYMDKWFRFSKDGMEIGSSDDGENIKLRLNNNRISFLSDDMEVAYISSNKLYITDGEFLNRLVLGNFGFIPRQNGNLSFKKVK